MDSVSQIETKPLIKAADEQKFFAFDFAKILEVQEGLIGTPTVTPSPTGLTISAVSIVGTQVRFKASGGSANVTYVVRVLADTSSGEKLAGSGLLEVTLY